MVHRFSAITSFSSVCNKASYAHISTDIIVFCLCIGMSVRGLYFCNYITVCSSLCKNKFLKLFSGVTFSP